MRGNKAVLTVFKWRFADAEYDCVLGTLTRSQEPIAITATQGALLECLLRAGGDWVDKEKLMIAGWHGRTVAHDVFTHTMQSLQALLATKGLAPLQADAQHRYQLTATITPIVDDLSATSEPALVPHDIAAPDTPQSAKRKWIGLLLIVVLVGAGVLIWQWSTPALPRTTPLATLAIVPFNEAIDSDDDGLLAEGLSDDLINHFMRTPGLAVIGRTSMYSLKESNSSLAEMAQRVTASHLITGNLRRQGDKLHVSVALIDALNLQTQWTREYHVDWNQMSSIQANIVADITRFLKMADQKSTLAQSDSTEAYTAYLQAQKLMRVGSEAAYKNAQEHFERALQLDPDYVQAMVGLANVYRRQSETAQRSVGEGFMLARQLAEKTLQYDTKNAHALNELAWIAFNYEHDIAKSVDLFQQAVSAAPNHLGTVANAAILLHDLGKESDAIRLSEYVVKYDPVNSRAFANLGLNYLSAGRLDDALASFQTALVISPKRMLMHYNIGVVHLLKGNYTAALAAMQREPSENFRLIGLVMACHSLQRNTEAQTLLADLISKYELDSAFNIAYVQAWMGNNDQAFAWLQKARDYRDPGLSEILVEPTLDKLKSDPRWLPFLRQVGLDPDQIAALSFSVELPY